MPPKFMKGGVDDEKLAKVDFEGELISALEELEKYRKKKRLRKRNL